MYNVLLVDDEENILNVLENLIQWQEFGVCEIYTARDGQKALEVFKQHKINLLITDIKMPHMDGIRLIERVKDLYPDVRCVLLTAYSEFEYARKAVSLGVDNYLMKPVIKEELEQTVKKSLEILYMNRLNDKVQMRENILLRWIGGNISSEELGERAVVLNLNLYFPQYCAICFVKKTLQNIGSLLVSYERLLSEKLEINSLWDEKGRYVMIVGGKEIDIKSLSQKLLRFTVSEDMVDKVRISIGEVVYDSAFLHLSYQEACDNIGMFRADQPCVIWHEDYFDKKLFTDYMIEEIRFLLFLDDEKACSNSRKRLGEKLYLVKQGKDSYDLLVKLWNNGVKILTTEFPLCTDLQECGLDLQKTNKTKLSKEEFMKEVEKVLLRIQQIYNQCFAQFSPIVQKAWKYAFESVWSGESCSIKEFCVRNNVNSAYLGQIFKIETGRFFNDYLLHCRISRSIVLLHKPTNSIKDIAKMLGFSSVSYFVQQFRKNMGISPDKYRNIEAR